MLLLTVALIAPLWMSWRTLGDGSLWEFALLTGEYSGLRDWLLGTGSYISWWCVLLVKWTSELGLNYVWVIKLFTTSLLVGLLFEVYLLCRDVVGLPEDRSLVCAVLTLAIGPWYLLVSYYVLVQLVCIFLALMGHRLLWARGTLTRSVGLCACFVGFQLNSTIVLLIALHVIRLWTAPPQHRRRSVFWGLAMFAAAVACFVGMRYAATTNLLYSNYNNLLDPTHTGNLVRLIRAAAMFTTWLTIPAVGLALLWVTKSWLSNASDSSYAKSSHRSFALPMSIAAVLFIAAIAPYILVGKGFALFTPTAYGSGLTEQVLRHAYAGWPIAPTFASNSARHMLLSAFALATLCVVLLDWLAFCLKKKVTALQIALFVAPFALLFTLGGHWSRLQQLYATEALLLGLREQSAPPAGVVEVAYDPASPWLVSTVDGSVLLMRAWGKPQYFAVIYGSQVFANDVKWQYHAYYKGVFKDRAEVSRQAMVGMQGFPGEDCISRYTATLPSARPWELMFAQWFSALQRPAQVRYIGGDCVPGRILENPTPEKIVIP